jgi:OmpR-family two-component system manganese-sensing response regulator
MNILLVDDEWELIEPLSLILRQEGYQVEVADHGGTGYALAKTGKYQLLILDWMLPEINGLEICRRVRQEGSSVPVLFLTAKDTIDDRVCGLDVGADDYLVKPFELRELLARVRALLRRGSSSETLSNQHKILVNDLTLDIENQLAHRINKTIELSEKETHLLAYLMSYPNQVLTHQQIHDYLWGETEPPSSNVLAALVRLLRRKIEIPQQPELIHTVYGKGYRFGIIEN